MYLFFDTETTGLPRNWKAPITDFENWPRLVQLAYQIFDNEGTLIMEGDYIIRPSGFIIPKEASEIHGITNEKAQSEGLSLSKVLGEFKLLLDETHTIVAHNINFDEKIIGCEFLRLSLSNPLVDKNKICTMESSTNFCAINGPNGYKWPKLSELHYKLFNTHFEEAHNAMIDIRATSKCFWELVKREAIVLTILSASNIQESKNEKTETQLVNYDLNHYMNVSHFFNESILLKHEKKSCLDMDVNELIMELHSLKMDKQPVSDEIIYWNDAWLGEDDDGQMHCVEEYEWYSYLALNLQCKINDIISLLKDYGITEESHPDLFGVEQQCLGNNNTVSQIDSSILIPYRQRNKWGFCTCNKSLVIDCIYDQVKRFNNGLAAVKLNEKWGYIDTAGVTIIPFDYEEALSFTDSNTIVKFNGNAYKLNKNKELTLIEELKQGNKWYFHGECFKQGKIVEDGSISMENFIPSPISIAKLEVLDDDEEPESDSDFNKRRPVVNGMKAYIDNGKIGFIPTDENLIIPAIYESAYDFIDDIAYVRINNKWGYINKNGVQYWED